MRPPPETTEQKLAAQQMIMQRIATENHRFAVTNASLRQEVAAAHQEIRTLHIHFDAIALEREQHLKTLLEKITKMEADLKDSEHVKSELQHAHAQAQSLVVERQELVSRVEHLSQEFQRRHGDLQQLSVMKSELEALRQEYQHLRATYEYESKLRSDHSGTLQVVTNHYISMANEVKKLRAALTNATNINPSGQPGGNARIDNIQVPVTSAYGHPGDGSVAQGAVDAVNSAPLYASVQTQPYGFAGAPSTLGSTQQAARGSEHPQTAYVSTRHAAYGSEQVPAVHDSTNQASYGSRQTYSTYGSTQQATYGSGQAPDSYGSTQPVTYGSVQSLQTSTAYGSTQQAAQEFGQNPNPYGLSQQATQVAYGSGQISTSHESTRQPKN